MANDRDAIEVVVKRLEEMSNARHHAPEDRRTWNDAAFYLSAHQAGRAEGVDVDALCDFVSLRCNTPSTWAIRAYFAALSSPASATKEK